MSVLASGDPAPAGAKQRSSVSSNMIEVLSGVMTDTAVYFSTLPTLYLTWLDTANYPDNCIGCRNPLYHVYWACLAQGLWLHYDDCKWRSGLEYACAHGYYSQVSDIKRTLIGGAGCAAWRRLVLITPWRFHWDYVSLRSQVRSLKDCSYPLNLSAQSLAGLS